MNKHKIRRITRARDKRADMLVQETIEESDAPALHAQSHSANGSDPITPSSIGAETPQGAQSKADTAEKNAKDYTDTHEGKSNPHSNSASKTEFDEHVNEGNPHNDSTSKADFESHINAKNPHISSQPIISFTTDNRPTNVSIGYMGFDIDLGIPIWWNGENWVNYEGTIV